MPNRTKPLPMTAEEIEKQAEQYHRLALSDHMDAGQFAQAHANLLDTAARVRYHQAQPEIIRQALADMAATFESFRPTPAAPMRPEEEN